MKKSLISLAVAGAIMVPMAAQAEATVYGKMHLSLGQVKDETGATTNDDNWQVRSHASRLGVKGSQDLGNGMSASFKIEYEVNPDGDNDGSESTNVPVLDNTGAPLGTGENVDVTVDHDGTAGLKRRNQYVGLKGGFGEVRFGRHDTPLKMAQGKFDQFNDTDADLKNGTVAHAGENRHDNVLAYINKFGSVGVAVALVPGEGNGESTGDGLADNTSLSVSYAEGPIYVAVAMDSHDDTAGVADTSNSMTRLAATYKMDNMQAGLLYQTGVEKVAASDEEETTIGLSFNMKAGPGKFKAQYVTSEDDATDSTEVELLALGYDYKLGKNTTVYGMFTSRDETSNDNDDTNDNEYSFVGGGVVVKF